MANQIRRRNPLLPWWIGLIVILAAVGYAAYRFACDDCGVAAFPEFVVLGVVPLVYLGLMYLVFRGQRDDETRNPRDYDPR
ncbi:MAG: hypothetical protein KIT43_04930 [Bauldia sp.]|nr:hypothetical protein [Bauldia sp.]MCW5717204.1 hypothetical protein [Bauldia sp.]